MPATKPPGQPADLLDLIEEAKYAQAPACLYDSPARGLAAREAEFTAWQAEYGTFGSVPRSHAWRVDSARRITGVDKTERCQPAILAAIAGRNDVQAPGCGCWQINALMHRGACTGCDWEGDPRGRHDTAVDDAHDHSWPGWRDLPFVPAMPGAAKARPEWLNRVTALYPAGWLEHGGPIRVLRDGRSHNHQATPFGGYALATPGVTVNCVFCAHTETGETPQAVHDLMEGHYAKKHARQIARLTGQEATR